MSNRAADIDADPGAVRAGIAELAALLPTSPESVFDLTGFGSAHVDACIRHWPEAVLFTTHDGVLPPGVTRIDGPRLAERQNWGAQSARRYGAFAPAASERADAAAKAEPTVTLDDYAAAHGVAQLSLLLLHDNGDSVATLLGAHRMLTSGRLEAVAVLSLGGGNLSDRAPALISGVLGKYDYAWTRPGFVGVALAVHRRIDISGPGSFPPPQKESWLDVAQQFGIAVEGVIHVGSYELERLAVHTSAARPLFLIDPGVLTFTRRRLDALRLTHTICIGAALSDVAVPYTLHVDAEGRSTHVVHPEDYLRAAGTAGTEQFVEVSTCTLDSLAAKYALSVANALVLDLDDGARAVLGGAVGVLRHLDVVSVTIDYRSAAEDPSSVERIDWWLCTQGFLRVSIHGTENRARGHAVYLRKERVWTGDPLLALRLVMQGAIVPLCRVGCLEDASWSAVSAAPSLPGLRAFCGVEVVRDESSADVVVLSGEDPAQFLALLRSGLESSRLCGIVVLGSQSQRLAEEALRVAFDHGFLLDRAFAADGARAYLRSAIIGHAPGWLALNNQFGRRDFKCSALGQLGRFGNQLFQIMHLMLAALRYDAKASTCPWAFNDYFQFGFLEGANPGTPLVVPPGVWQVMGFWGLEEMPENIDFHAHFQWIAPFLSRHREFLGACFELKPEWAARALSVVQSLTEGGAKRLAAFHVRRTDYLLTGVMENPWHQEIPIDWYRAALEKHRGATLYAASDDLDYVVEALPGIGLKTYREFENDGLPPLLIDHCVMRAADTLLLVNSTFSRTAALFAPESQTVEIPSIRDRRFEPYAPWHDPVFWFRFDDRYFAHHEQHAQTVEAWLTAVGVPALTDDER